MSDRTLLPKSEMTLRQMPDGRIVVSAYVNAAGYRHYQIFARSELPNEIVSAADLERLLGGPA